MNNIISIEDFIKNEDGTFNVEVSAFINASAETIYDILTNRESMAEFMSCDMPFEIEVGAQIDFVFNVAYTDVHGVTHEPPAISSGKVVEMVPNKLFSFTWGDARGFDPNFPAGMTLVEFKIEPGHENGNDGCRVTIHHHNLLNKPYAEDHCEGWSYHLGNCVARFS